MTPAPISPANLRARWRLPLLLALLLIGMVVARSMGLRQSTTVVHSPATNSPAADLPDANPGGKIVTLAIRTADGNERHDFVAWHDGMTVEDLLIAASRLPKGVEFAQQGSGASALLTEMNGTANEGGDGRNWTYAVNGQEADRSFAVYQLQPGDHVLWTFTAKQ